MENCTACETSSFGFFTPFTTIIENLNFIGLQETAAALINAFPLFPLMVANVCVSVSPKVF